MHKYDEAIIAADISIGLCPGGYIKPRINKALCLQKLKKQEEARLELENAILEAGKLGNEGKGDKELAEEIMTGLSVLPLPDNDLLRKLTVRIVNAVQLTSRKELVQWNNTEDSSELLAGLKNVFNYW